MLPALLTLTDVMGTGHHAALAAGVGPGLDGVRRRDGAVGLCAVLAARRRAPSRSCSCRATRIAPRSGGGSGRPT
jgi:threonine dehydrogenase-like Zn-dependent dehydrogenase